MACFVNQAKCIFGQNEVTFLRYRISAAGSFPPTDRKTAIREFSRPTTFAELRRFLGTMNFYHRFLPKAAELEAPLNAVLGKSRHNKGSKPVPWTPALEEAFIACKNGLAQATLLAQPKMDAPLATFSDASQFFIGAVLQQRVYDSWQPLAFFSRKLSAAQQTWPAYYRELLAGYAAFKHFREMVSGHHFI